MTELYHFTLSHYGLPALCPTLKRHCWPLALQGLDTGGLPSLTRPDSHRLYACHRTGARPLFAHYIGGHGHFPVKCPQIKVNLSPAQGGHMLSMVIRNFALPDGAGRKHSGSDGHHVKRRTFLAVFSHAHGHEFQPHGGCHDRSAPRLFPELHCFSSDISPDCRCGSCKAGCQGIIAAAYFSPRVLFFKTKSGRKRILRFLPICFYCTAALFRRLFFHVSTRNSVSTE